MAERERERGREGEGEREEKEEKEKEKEEEATLTNLILEVKLNSQDGIDCVRSTFALNAAGTQCSQNTYTPLLLSPKSRMMAASRFSIVHRLCGSHFNLIDNHPCIINVL